jgi:hypothetical protein
LLLLAVLLAALVASRSCANQQHEIGQDEAVAIAKEHASFVPCDEVGCVQVRALNQGIPVRLVWIVGLAERLGPNGTPLRHENFEIDADTGEVTRRG